MDGRLQSCAKDTLLVKAKLMAAHESGNLQRTEVLPNAIAEVTSPSSK
jgi:hypothetical protein